MFHKELNGYAVTAWLLTAMTAPLCQLAGNCSWPTALLAAGVLGMLCWAVCILPRGYLETKKWFCAIQFLWLIVLSAVFADWSADAWPTGTDYPVVPLTLLALAVLSAHQGLSGASRTSAVLFWFVVLLYAVILVAGSQKLHMSYLRTSWELPDTALFLALLLPAVLGLLQVKGHRYTWLPFAAVTVFFVAASVFAEGTLGSTVCQEESWPFYEASKSISLLGVAERFESLVSVAMTMGYFSLYSLLLTAAGNMAENIHKEWGRAGVILAGTIAGVLMLWLPIQSGAWLVIITLILWVLLPLFGGFVGNVKKAKKNEKSP